MAGPEFARTRLEVLGVRNLPKWFELLRPDAPPDNPQAEFIPSTDEYRTGAVYRPEISDIILRQLQSGGVVLVRGVGASGKTVLALLLGIEVSCSGVPAYYLDLARIGLQETGSGLEEDLVQFGHPNALFVVDNIHRNEHLASRLVAAREEMVVSQRPRLLLLGRELQTGRGSPVSGTDVRTVVLRARQAEVLRVYRRIIRRGAHAGVVADPPADVLDEWVKTFGGDPLPGLREALDQYLGGENPGSAIIP